MPKRYFVQLAHVYKNQDVAGWLMSEKLDGMRAYWDGGVTRGLPCADVPWANTEKDSIRLEEQISTGLWSRGGKKIPCPDEWANKLPDYPLDGELYLGPGMFQQVMSTCKGSDNDWSDVQYAVYGMPTLQYQFEYGEMCFNANQKITLTGALDFWLDRADSQGYSIDHYKGCKLKDVSGAGDNWYAVEQVKLPMRKQDYMEVINKRMDKIMAVGGEGLMLANPYAWWKPHRTHDLLKVKRFNEGEGTVVGYVWGRETDKGSKLANLMGQLRLKFGDHIFGISGFTEEERILHNVDGGPTNINQWQPGEHVGCTVHSLHFPPGTTVRFKYRELSDDGVPKEARYWR